MKADDRTDDGPAGSGDTNGQETRHEGAGEAVPYKPKYTPLWNNFITEAGLFLAAVAVMLVLTFGLMTLVTPRTNPYVDIVGYAQRIPNYPGRT